MVGTKKSKFKKDKDKIYILITILTIFIISVVGYNYFLKESVVDRDVKLKLLVDDDVRVNVVFINQGNDEPNIQLQEEVLNSLLSSEFELETKSLGGKWISGNITKEGINKLENDLRVKRISLPRITKVFKN